MLLLRVADEVLGVVVGDISGGVDAGRYTPVVRRGGTAHRYRAWAKRAIVARAPVDGTLLGCPCPAEA